MSLELFAPITKVDEQRRLVFGTVAEEVVDKTDEIFDYASSKPLFEAWSADIAKASDGRSVGNLRAMHGLVAAGKLTDITFDDDARRIEAVGRVIDDGEWRKVLEGVYTGFSIGGHYAERWPDPVEPGVTRYTAQPTEISLVDNPCIPTATFSVLRADGSIELRKFKSGTSAADDGEHAVAANAPCGTFAKVGARHSKADLALVNAIHRLAVELGADCPASGDADDAEPAKLARLAKRVEQLTAELAGLGELRALVEELRNEPTAPKGGLYVVDKSADGVRPIDGTGLRPEPETPEAAIKAALGRPMRLHPSFD